VSIFVFVLGPFLTTCGTIHFLVDDCPVSLFTTDHRSLVLFYFFANLSVDIGRRPIFFCMNRPGWSISTNFCILSIELTIDIDRNSPQV